MNKENEHPEKLEFIRYPAGSRFIGPGDDVVISAAKLAAYLAQERIKAQIAELKNALDENAPFGEGQQDVAVGYIEYRIAQLQRELEGGE